MEKSVCDHSHCQEWNPELWNQLQNQDVRRIEGDKLEYVYHKTRQSVERWLAWNWDHRKERIKGYYDAKTGRKNYHLLGRKIANSNRKLKNLEN